MRMDKAIRDFLIEIEVRKYTPKIIRSYKNNLGLFLRFCEEKANVEDTEDLSLPLVKQFAQLMSDAGRSRTHCKTAWSRNRWYPRFAAYLPPFLRPTAHQDGDRPLHDLPPLGA